MILIGYVATVDPAVRRSLPARALRLFGRGCAWLAVLALIAAVLLTLPEIVVHATLQEVRASQPQAGTPAAPRDAREVAVTVTANRQRAPWRTTVAELQTSPEMWKRMDLADWNAVPASIRETALAGMLAAYADELSRPATWDRMSVFDWDEVPSPIRVAAFRRMTAYWVGYYRLADRYHLSPLRVSETAQAIVMSESWWDHRALASDRSGNVDLGLGQASTFARDRIREMHAAGVLEFSLSDADYLNPWKATRFVAVWLGVVLDEARGNLDTAVRAYNRGIAAAADAGGDRYFAAVFLRRQRYIRSQGAPPAWQTLVQLMHRDTLRGLARGNGHDVREAEDPRQSWNAAESGRGQPGGAGDRLVVGAGRTAAGHLRGAGGAAAGSAGAAPRR